MSVQSLSIVVPNKRCINDCAFCVILIICVETLPLLSMNFSSKTKR